MILTLEVSGAAGAQLGPGRRSVFRDPGGTLGRDGANQWVLPDAKVSGRHARITYRGGTFYIEDTSRNGVCLNSSKNRLEPGRPYALHSGDRILIEPYEIQVSVGDELEISTRSMGGGGNPFGIDDPFGAADFSPLLSPEITPHAEAGPDQVVDPLRLIGGGERRPPAQQGPTVRELQHGSPWEAHYRPPAITRDPAFARDPGPAPQNDSMIPQGYNPVLDDSGISPAPPPEVISRKPYVPRESFEPLEPIAVKTPPPIVAYDPPPAVVYEPPPAYEPPAYEPPAEPEPRRPTPPPFPSTPTPSLGPIERRPASDDDKVSFLAQVLEGAGLEGAPVTPDLARNFGQILRIVVSGVMDVLQARQAIKEEFRMHVTHFRPADNNPLKFSANVDDALHNLLVKRNAAYLPPVEAFADAFDDLRHHQMAMLAGMRVAFEATLGEFDPDKLQQQFDRQLDKGSLLSVPAKLRYWDLYRDLCRDLVKDPEASFRKLFGEEFAEAYEKQLTRLKRDRAAARPGDPPARG